MQNETRRDRERKLHEEEIIASAAAVFGAKGFDRASMDEIAAAADFTKRTVYLYFEAKEDLFFAAALRAFRTLHEALKDAAKEDASGYEKLLGGCRAYYRFSRDDPENMRLLNEVGLVKKKAGENSSWLKELMKFDDELFQWVAQGLSEGKKDGSIRGDLDSLKATFSIVFIMTGFFNQLSLTGTSFLEHFALNPEEFSEYSMELLFSSLRQREVQA